MARAERNPASLYERIKQLAGDYGVIVTGVDTAFPDRGPVGVGSESIVSLKVPKVAVIAGDETSQTSYAEITYLLGHEYGVEFVPLTVEAFKNTPFGGFNVLILPDGRAKQYRDAFDKDGVEKLKDWCKDGGTLICVGGAAGFAADKKVNLTGSRVVAADLMAKADEADEKGSDDEVRRHRQAAHRQGRPGRRQKTRAAGIRRAGAVRQSVTQGRSGRRKNPPGKEKSANPGPTGDTAATKPIVKGFDRRKIPLPVPGAILRAQLNLDHFLTYGYDQPTLPVLVDTDQFLTPTKRGANVVTFPAAPADGKDAPPLRLSGFVWPDNTERLIRGTAAVVEEPLGDGPRHPHRQRPEFASCSGTPRPACGSTACSTHPRSTATTTIDLIPQRFPTRTTRMSPVLHAPRRSHPETASLPERTAVKTPCPGHGTRPDAAGGSGAPEEATLARVLGRYSRPALILATFCLLALVGIGWIISPATRFRC